MGKKNKKKRKSAVKNIKQKASDVQNAPKDNGHHTLQYYPALSGFAPGVKVRLAVS